MPHPITIQIHSPRWKSRLRPYGKTVREACGAALRQMTEDGGRRAEMTVVLADDAFIKTLNKDFRGKDKPTNVLSFPEYIFTSPLRGEVVRRSRAGGGGRSQKNTPTLTLPPQGGGNIFLGDLVLALETIEREAKEQDKSFKDHVKHLLVHGTLHLLGYDHEKEKDAGKMEALEVKILKGLGVRNPYL